MIKLIDGDPYLFLDKIYTGVDVEFEYKGRKLWSQGYWNEDTKLAYMEVYDYTDEDNVFYILEIDYRDGDRIKIFENAALFNGKTFWEAEQDIRWVY